MGLIKADETNNPNEHNSVKIPTAWWEADQLALYRRDRGVELRSTEKQFQLSGQSGTLTRDLRVSVMMP